MKKNNLVYLAIAVIFSISCQKFDDASPITFEVSVDAATVKAGEPVTFNFVGGDVHQVAFYSGDVGNSYEYRDKSRIDEIKKVFFSFQTHNIPEGHEVFPEVLISHDFNGQYDYESVSKATWNSMSDLFTWGPHGPWQTMWTGSGNTELTDRIEPGAPFYVAFRVKSDPQATGSISRNWRTRGHSLIAETTGGDFISLANYSGMSWKLIDRYLAASEIAEQSTSVVSGSIMLLGYYRNMSPRYRMESEIWGVSKKFESAAVDLGSEGSIVLKEYVDPPLETYTHYYETPGVYKVVFIASNATISSSNQVIKELEITVTR